MRERWWLREVGCLLLVLAAGWPLLVGRTTCLDDLQRIALPLLAIAQRALSQGELVVWAPELFCGYSAHAAGQVGGHYPVHLLLLACLPLLSAFKASVLLHLWLLARGIQGAATALGASPRAALLAAGVAVLGGVTVGHHHHLNILVGLGWTGPILWLTVRAVRDERPAPSVLLLGGAYGLALLQAQPQYVLYAGIAALALLPAARRPDLPWSRIAFRLGAAGALGLVLAWVQLLPTLTHIAVNPRPRPEGEFAFLTRIAADGRDALRLLHPDLWGTPLRGTWAGEAPHYWEARAHVGAPILALALARLLRRPYDTPLVRAGLGLVLVGALLAPGAASPLTHLVVHLPPFNLFRNPARYLWLVQLGLALLAAAELNDLGRAARGPRALAWAIVGLWLLVAIVLSARADRLGDWLLRPSGVALVLGLFAVGPTLLAGHAAARRRWSAAALGLALLELTLAWHAFALTVPDADLTTPPPLAAPIVAADPDRRRTLDLVSAPARPGLGTSRRLRSNSGAIWGITYFTGGNEALPPLQQTAQLERLRQAHEAPSQHVPQLLLRFEPACDRFGIEWIVSDRRLPTDDRLRQAAAVDGVWLYRNLDARPPAYTLPLSALRSEETISTPEDRDSPIGPAQILEHGRGRWRVASDGPRPRFVVVNETWDPDWEATVDGQPAATLIAEELFVAVAVPPGDHVVELRYASREVALGRVVSGLGWLAWLTAFALIIIRRRRS